MLGRSLLLLSAALSTLASAQTSAPPEPGYRFQKYTPAAIPDRSLSNQDKARATLNAYAACLIQFRPQAVIAFLKLPVGSHEADVFTSRLSVSECLSEEQLSASRTAIHGALYISLYKQSYGRVAPSLSAEPIDYKSDIPAEVSARATTYVAARRFAECVVRSDPIASRVLVLSQVGSTDERDAFARISPQLSSCLAQGTEIKFSKTILSGLIAEALYSLSVPAVDAGQQAER